jgi:hypothetical protein
VQGVRAYGFFESESIDTHGLLISYGALGPQEVVPRSAKHITIQILEFLINNIHTNNLAESNRQQCAMQ